VHYYQQLKVILSAYIENVFVFFMKKAHLKRVAEWNKLNRVKPGYIGGEKVAFVVQHG